MKWPDITKNKIHIVEVIGCITSIAGLIYAFVVETNWQGLYITIMVTVNFIFLLFILIHLIKLSNISSLKAGYYCLRNITNSFRKEIGNMEKTTITLKEAKESKFILDVLENLKNTFDNITKSKCATCIKLHTPSGKIITLERDSVSSAKREPIDNKRLFSKVDSNTASKQIIKNDKAYFFSNDLTKLSGYENNRPDFDKVYRSTIVWSIRSFNNETGEYVIPALLCVDSEDINIFDEDICIEIGECAADILYAYFSCRNIITETKPKAVSETVETMPV